MKRNRRNLSPEDKKRKELVRELLKLNPINLYLYLASDFNSSMW